MVFVNSLNERWKTKEQLLLLIAGEVANNPLIGYNSINHVKGVKNDQWVVFADHDIRRIMKISKSRTRLTTRIQAL